MDTKPGQLATLARGQVNRLGVGGNNVCCLVIVVIFMGLGDVEVGGLNSSYGGKLKGRHPQSKRGEGNFYGGVDPSAVLSELPTCLRLYWCKKSSMICTT